MKIYTHKQLQSSFEAGMRKYQHPLEAPGFVEWTSQLDVPQIDEDIYNEVVHKTSILKLKNRKPLSSRSIISAVVRATHEDKEIEEVMYADLTAKAKVNRQKDILTIPRQVAYYLCYLHLENTYKGVGRFFGGRDHTTILHGVKNVHGWKGNDPVVSTLLERTYTILKDQGYNTDIHTRKVNKLKALEI